MDVKEMAQDAVVVHVNGQMAAIKTTGAVSGAVASYWTLNEAVAIATLIFVILQVGLIIPKYWLIYKQWRHGAKIKIDVDNE